MRCRLNIFYGEEGKCMFALERQNRILELLATDGAVWVSKLAVELNVTEETVRRDLEKLEKQESLRRTHGGAVPIDGTTYELSLEKRKHTNVEEKAQLAKIAAGYVVTGDTVFLDASTTTFYMAKELKSMSNITVITNSIRVIEELQGSDGIKVIAVGGIVSRNESFVGTMAEKCIEDNYFASKMFFSSKGVTASAGILESNEQECGIKKKMMKNAGSKYYICDKSKLGRVGFVKLSDFSDIDYFITGALDDETLRSRLTDSETHLVTSR